MTATQQQVQEACRDIETHLTTFRDDPKRVIELMECVRTIWWLREEYRTDKAAFTASVDRIKTLSAEVHKALAAGRDALSTLYLEAVGEAVRWRSTREACRDALLELASVERIDRFDAPGGWLEVKQIRSLSLPKADTPQREALCGVITRAGRWPEVATPNAARLLKAVDKGGFEPDEAGEITRLCPVRTTSRLVGHFSDR